MAQQITTQVLNSTDHVVTFCHIILTKCHKMSPNFRQASFVTERHHVTGNAFCCVSLTEASSPTVADTALVFPAPSGLPWIPSPHSSTSWTTCVGTTPCCWTSCHPRRPASWCCYCDSSVSSSPTGPASVARVNVTV